MIYLSFVCFKGDDVAGIWTHGFKDVETLDDLYFLTANHLKKSFQCDQIIVYRFDANKKEYERIGKFVFGNDEMLYLSEHPVEFVAIEGKLDLNDTKEKYKCPFCDEEYETKEQYEQCMQRCAKEEADDIASRC